MKGCECEEVTDNAQSFSEISIRVDKAIRDTYGVGYVHEYYSDCVIFRLGERLLKVDYSVDKKTGKITLSDTAPAEVLKTVTYRPVLNHDSLNAARQVLANWSPEARKAAALARKSGRGGLKSRAMGAIRTLLSKFKGSAGGGKKTVKTAKDKSGEQKAGQARSQARQAKLQAKLKAHRDAKSKKAEVSKKTKTLTRKVKKNTASIKAKAAKTAKTAKAPAKGKDGYNKKTSSKEPNARVVAESKVKSGNKPAAKSQRKITQKDLDKQRKKNTALKAKAAAGRADINKSKEKLKLARKINKVNAATRKKERGWDI
jgi:hypothetical protein